MRARPRGIELQSIPSSERGAPEKTPPLRDRPIAHVNSLAPQTFQTGKKYDKTTLKRVPLEKHTPNQLVTQLCAVAGRAFRAAKDIYVLNQVLLRTGTHVPCSS
jgi:hypothetical protein